MSNNNDFNPAAYVAQAIAATQVAEVVRDNSDPTRLSYLCRVLRKRIWCEILEYVLVRKTNWNEHVCQQYFLRGGKLVYGWNVIAIPKQGSDIADVAEEVARLVIEGARVVPKAAVTRGPLDEFPLVGASPRRTMNIVFDPRLPGPDKGGPSHKGAYGIKSGE